MAENSKTPVSSSFGRGQALPFQARLPSAKGEPLPSLEMAQLVGVYLPDDFTWNNWTIRGVATMGRHGEIAPDRARKVAAWLIARS